MLLKTIPTYSKDEKEEDKPIEMDDNSTKALFEKFEKQ